MIKTRKIFDRALAMLLSLLMLFTMMPINSVYAMTPVPGEVSTDLESIEFIVNETAEFTVTSTANDDAGKMIKGSFVFSDPDAIEKRADSVLHLTQPVHIQLRFLYMRLPHLKCVVQQRQT